MMNEKHETIISVKEIQVRTNNEETTLFSLKVTTFKYSPEIDHSTYSQILD